MVAQTPTAASGGTLRETHLLRKEGREDVYYTEEHWSSVIKSFVTNAPPKFKQVGQGKSSRPKI